jgi:hypothetical protein
MKWIFTLLGSVVFAPLMPLLMGCLFLVGGLVLYLLWSCAHGFLVWGGVYVALAIVIHALAEVEKRSRRLVDAR